METEGVVPPEEQTESAKERKREGESSNRKRGKHFYSKGKHIKRNTVQFASEAAKQTKTAAAAAAPNEKLLHLNYYL